jgi:hypothetical protein
MRSSAFCSVAPQHPKTGKTPNLESGCALARLSQASIELVAQIHPRMPVILPAQHHGVWLGETDGGNLKELLLPYPADQMQMWEISPRVNSPKNNDPSLWEPLHSEPTQATTDSLELVRENAVRHHIICSQLRRSKTACDIQMHWVLSRLLSRF